MAARNATPRGVGLGGWLTAGFFAGSAALFVGERILDGRARMWASGIGLGLVLATSAARAALALGGSRERRTEHRWFALAHAVALLGIALYAASTDAGLARLGHAAPLDEAGKRLRDSLRVLFPIAWLAGALPIALLERATPPRGVTRPPEDRRLTEAALGGASLAFAAALLFVVNYLAAQHDTSADFSYFRTARPGAGTQDLVARLAEPVEVILFFPAANEVAEEVAGYFRELAGASPFLSVARKDRLLDADLAKQHKIRTDGVVLLSQGETGKQWTVGTELDNARHNLRKLDKEVYTRLVELARSKRTAYLTQGHGELGDRPFDSESRATWIRTLLRRLNYDVKNLGLADGLGHQVPTDASVVVILSPEEPFSPEEIESLVRYLDRGGRLLAALDPGQGANVGRLLDALGVALGDGTLANDNPSYYLPRRYSEADRQNLVTASYSSHPSVQGLSRGGRRASVVTVGSTYLERAKETGGATIDFPVRSMTGTWADRDGDFAFSADREEKKVYQLAAAVERKSPVADPSGEEVLTRALVFGDGDLFADLLLQHFVGNGILLGDGLEWLAGGTASTDVESEEDVAVQHTREDDAAWFYGTVFGAPLVVLALGLGSIRLRRRRRS